MGLERITDLRKQVGMTIDELSIRSGIPVSTLKKISAGLTANPTLDTVKAIARALNCSIDEFDDFPAGRPAQQDGLSPAKQKLISLVQQMTDAQAEAFLRAMDAFLSIE